ncbi:MAG: DUF86 domain-containing protein [Nanoarchaeota archaeon]|nr:DUF86 domain-containing protein [Nanoarchaeota archaeon]
MIKSDIPYMNYIIDIIKDIEDSMKDTSKNNFNKDKKDANIRRLEIISESIKNISAELKNKYPDIEWKKFENLKYIFMNNYFGVDLDIVWEIIKNDIPKLKQEIEEIINKEKQVN